jgi:two-component system cell cycle sensor histidine kinase/response regulator CckA
MSTCNLRENRGSTLARASQNSVDMRVLLVDDDSGIRALGALVLRHAGHAVLTADRPLEALEMIRADSDIGLVVTDIVMPEMNGFDLADELHQVAPWVRIVFMSGFTSDSFRQAVDVPFVSKPFTPASLAAGVEQALT